MNLLIAVTVATQLAAAHPSPELRGEDLMRALRSGGYTIVLRHARTDQSIPSKEKPGYSPPLRSDQRNLTATGEQDVRLMQAVVQKYALPIGEVISSPAYRCQETAAAFGPASVTMTLRAFPTTAETAALVAAAPKPGTDRVLVTHHFVIENHVPGISQGDVGESEAVVVRPDGAGKVVLVGRIKLADWQTLAGAPASEPGQAPVAVHQPPDAPVTIPATPAGRLATAYLAAFNSGDAETMRAFTESSLTANPDRPTEVRIQAYRKLFEEHGPITVTAIRSTEDDKIALKARSKAGDLVITVTASPDQAGRAQSVTFGILPAGGGH